MKNILYFLILLLTFLSVIPANAQRANDFSQRSIDAHTDLVPLGFPDPAIRLGSERMLVGRRMTLDLFSGLGLSNTNAVFSNYQNRTTSKADRFFEGQNYIAGKRIVAHISVGLRVGMLLWTDN